MNILSPNSPTMQVSRGHVFLANDSKDLEQELRDIVCIIDLGSRNYILCHMYTYTLFPLCPV